MKTFKIFFLTLAFTLCQYTHAQDAEIRDFTEFNKILITNRISVLLIPSNEAKTIIEAENISKVVTSISNGTLKISTKYPNIKGKGIKVQLFYKTLDKITANTGAMVTAKKPLKNKDLEITLYTDAEANLNIDTEQVDISTSEGAQLTLTGKCEKLEGKSTTGGKIIAKDLDCKDVEVKSTFGGKVEVSSSYKAHIKSYTGGSVTLFGKPKDIESKVGTGGKFYDKTENKTTQKTPTQDA